MHYVSTQLTMNSKKKNTKKRRNFGNNLFFPHTEFERALPQQKVSKLDICFVSPSLLLLFLTETLAAFFHILYFANISIENLKTKTLANTFGLHLRIVMTVPNWNSEDNGKLFIQPALDEAVFKSKLAETQETITYPS